MATQRNSAACSPRSGYWRSNRPDYGGPRAAVAAALNPHSRAGSTTDGGGPDCGYRQRTGTLYTALDRLLQQELIAVHSEEVVAGRLRRSYVLTHSGRELLESETERLRATLAEAERRLALGFRPRPAGGVA